MGLALEGARDDLERILAEAVGSDESFQLRADESLPFLVVPAKGTEGCAHARSILMPWQKRAHTHARARAHTHTHTHTQHTSVRCILPW